jgi:biopolymer transport protein ExbB
MPLSEIIRTVQDFLETGGHVLTAIMAVTFLMWTLILERFWHFRFAHPAEVNRVRRVWDERKDKSSRRAHQIRRLLISQVQLKLDHSLFLIRTLVVLCPLLGLLGTVTGMIDVFDVMAVAGSGNVRAMAAGVSKATIPTMAGMVAALSGLIFSVQLDRFARSEGERVADQLTCG